MFFFRRSQQEQSSPQQAQQSPPQFQPPIQSQQQPAVEPKPQQTFLQQNQNPKEWLILDFSNNDKPEISIPINSMSSEKPFQVMIPSSEFESEVKIKKEKSTKIVFETPESVDPNFGISSSIPVFILEQLIKNLSIQSASFDLINTKGKFLKTNFQFLEFLHRKQKRLSSSEEEEDLFIIPKNCDSENVLQKRFPVIKNYVRNHLEEFKKIVDFESIFAKSAEIEHVFENEKQIRDWAETASAFQPQLIDEIDKLIEISREIREFSLLSFILLLLF